MSLDVDAFLARLQLPARVSPDVAGLARLQRAHRLAIPFENLDVVLGRPIAIDGAAVFAKLVSGGRGGYCFEHNRLFGDALAAFGFTVRPVLARVWLGVEAGDPVPPLTHVLSLVTIDGQEWIADAGFGGSDTPPMPLVEGTLATAPDGAAFRLDRDPEHGWTLWRDGDPATTDGRSAGENGGTGWRRQYSMTLAPVFDADLALSNHWTSTAPGSRFTRHRIVSLVLPHGFAALTDRQYRRRAGAQAVAEEIVDPRVYRMRLSLMFGISLSREEVATLFEGTAAEPR